MSTCQSYTLRRIAWILCLLYAPAAVAQSPTSQPVDVYDSAYFLWETQIGKSLERMDDAPNHRTLPVVIL